MSMPVRPCINEALPTEVFSVIFEEHAKLEWRAPLIDGLVCQQWRQTILRSPRAWAYLEIRDDLRSDPFVVCKQWLGRSGTAPLHIQIHTHWDLKQILDLHYKRTKSLTVRQALSSFLELENQSFPILQSLTIDGCGIYHPDGPTFRLSTWHAMPALRSLRLRNISVKILLSKAFPALRVLALSQVEGYDCIIQNSYHSLTTLMLDEIQVPSTPETLEFPSLNFLSLLGVKGLKSRMSVPALTTYHEGCTPKEESFSMPLPSLTEYGIYEIYTDPLRDATRLHQCYPNLSLISLRARPSSVKALLHFLSSQPTSLPMLRILAVEFPFERIGLSKEDKESMMNAVSVRNTATSVEMELCFDGKLRAPLYFAIVRVYIKYGRGKLTSIFRRRMKPIEELSYVLSLWLGC